MDNLLEFREKHNNVVNIKEAKIICGESVLKVILIKNKVLESVEILINFNGESKIIKSCVEIKQLSEEIKQIFKIWGNCDVSKLAGRFAESYAACTYNINAIINGKKQRAFPTWLFDGRHSGDLIMTTQKGLKKMRNVANTAFGKFGKDLLKFKKNSNPFRYYKKILKLVPNRAMVQIKTGKFAAINTTKEIYKYMKIAGSHCTKRFFTFRGVNSFKIYQMPLKFLGYGFKHNPIELFKISIKFLNNIKTIKYIKSVGNFVKTSKVFVGATKVTNLVGKISNKIALPLLIMTTMIDINNHVEKYKNGEETVLQACYRSVLDIVSYNELKYIVTHPVKTIKNIWDVITNPKQIYGSVKNAILELNDKFSRHIEYIEYESIIEKRILQDHKFDPKYKNPRTLPLEYIAHIKKYYDEYHNIYQKELRTNIKKGLFIAFEHLHYNEYNKACATLDSLDKIHFTEKDVDIVLKGMEYDAYLKMKEQYEQQLHNIENTKNNDYLNYLEILEKLPESTLIDLNEIRPSKYKRYGITLMYMISSSIINHCMIIGERWGNGKKEITFDDVVMVSLGTIQNIASESIMKSKFTNFNPSKIEMTWLTTKSAFTTNKIFGKVDVAENIITNKEIEIKAKIDTAKTKTEIMGGIVAGVLCSAISFLAIAYQKRTLKNDKSVKEYIKKIEEKIEELKKNCEDFKDMEDQLIKFKIQFENETKFTANDFKNIVYDGCKGGIGAYTGVKLVQKGVAYFGEDAVKKCTVGSSAVVGGIISLSEGIYKMTSEENKKLKDYDQNKVTVKSVVANTVKTSISNAVATGLTLMVFSNPVGWTVGLCAFTFGAITSVAVGATLSLGDNYCSKQYGQKREYYLHCCKQLNIEINQQIDEHLVQKKFKCIMAKTHPNNTNDIDEDNFTKRVNELLPYVIFMYEYNNVKIDDIDKYQKTLYEKVIELINKRIAIISQFEFINIILKQQYYIMNVTIQPITYECIDCEFELKVICGLENIDWNYKVVYEIGLVPKHEIKLLFPGKIFDPIINTSKIKGLHLTSNKPENNINVINRKLAEKVWLVFLSDETAENYINSEKQKIYC